MHHDRKASVEHVREHYDPMLADARGRIRTDPSLGQLLDPATDAELVLGFLIYFSALGVEMTRPVEGWIARAGRRCEELGHTELGRALIRHARHEAGHHTMMVDDLRLLVSRWNQAHRSELEVEELLALPATDAMRRYVAIHEDTIASTTPYGQIAIEYEIEGMSVVLGPALMQACSRALGREIVAEMSFIREHTVLDVGHTAMNQAELGKFLRRRPDDAEFLASLGASALHIYLDFLGECVNKSRTLLAFD